MPAMEKVCALSTLKRESAGAVISPSVRTMIRYYGLDRFGYGVGLHRGFGFGFGTTWRSPAKNHTPTPISLCLPPKITSLHCMPRGILAGVVHRVLHTGRRQQQQRAATIFIYPLPSYSSYLDTTQLKTSHRARPRATTKRGISSIHSQYNTLPF